MTIYLDDVDPGRLRPMLAPLDKTPVSQWTEIDVQILYSVYCRTRTRTAHLPHAWAAFRARVRSRFGINLRPEVLDSPRRLNPRDRVVLTFSDSAEIAALREDGVAAANLILFVWDGFDAAAGVVRCLVGDPVALPLAAQPTMATRWERLGRPSAGLVFSREPGGEEPIPLAAILYPHHAR